MYTYVYACAGTSALHAAQWLVERRKFSFITFELHCPGRGQCDNPGWGSGTLKEVPSHPTLKYELHCEPNKCIHVHVCPNVLPSLCIKTH